MKKLIYILVLGLNVLNVYSAEEFVENSSQPGHQGEPSYSSSAMNSEPGNNEVNNEADSDSDQEDLELDKQKVRERYNFLVKHYKLAKTDGNIRAVDHYFQAIKNLYNAVKDKGMNLSVAINAFIRSEEKLMNLQPIPENIRFEDEI